MAGCCEGWSARRRVVALTAALALAGCGGPEAESREVEPEAVSVGMESVVIARSEELSTGPILSGTLEAERAATVRSETGGSVVATYADEGDRVRSGALLARIEDAAVGEALRSAQSGVRSAESAHRTAQREAERAERLVAGGALAERDLELARSNLAGAQAQLADARARLSSAQRQLDNTRVRAPLAGVVSRRAVNAGDVVAPGALLFTVIDPRSMRLAATVASERLGALRVGTPVEFQVRGYPGRTFRGTVQRINPAVDPVTRQVPVYVALPNEEGALVSGLFAEGQVQSERRRAVVVPAEAVEESGAAPTVLRVRGGVVERAEVRVGLRDPVTERVEIQSGVQPGDTLLSGAARSITPGTRVRLGTSAASVSGQGR
jgi:membrane fusion protein (multidrug efflux system)